MADRSQTQVPRDIAGIARAQHRRWQYSAETDGFSFEQFLCAMARRGEVQCVCGDGGTTLKWDAKASKSAHQHGAIRSQRYRIDKATSASDEPGSCTT
jgi:hypothetical protein